MRHQRSIVACVSLLTAWVAIGEPLYVDDKLVLNVYAEPEQGGDRIATIETGDVVEELERVEKFVRVRLSDGREGWVGVNYMSAQPPAIIKLKELQAATNTSTNTSSRADDAQAKRLTSDVARLQKQNASLTAEITELKKQLAATLAENPVPAVVAAPASEPEEELAGPAPVVQSSYWWVWLVAVIAAAGLGYYVGYQTLGRRVRARFGGVKVY